jgi:hypothetical protein
MVGTIPEIARMDELITVVIGLLILRNVYTIFPAKSSFVHKEEASPTIGCSMPYCHNVHESELKCVSGAFADS